MRAMQRDNVTTDRDTSTTPRAGTDLLVGRREEMQEDARGTKHRVPGHAAHKALQATPTALDKLVVETPLKLLLGDGRDVDVWKQPHKARVEPREVLEAARNRRAGVLI